ncbi:uncharacterized protein LOC126690108 [Quercus robur]|uniref:uncharacterized protein LOC126690108 n=1 Tax=Quercus robur TaxID=38942 RepID=UPI0021617DDA|nr:uncharacterized protein LOC126690108 [Quercus robur]
MEVGSNLFQFKFQKEFEMKRVFKGGPWTFDNQALMLCRWQMGLTARNVKFDSIPMWVQIWDAPFDMVSPKVAVEVGSRLGVVVEEEKRLKLEAQRLFMRVRVAIPISKPIRKGGFVAGSDGTRYWVKFKYERLPLFCHYCGLLGHDLRHCASYYAASKNSGDVMCQYSDWMKAVGSRTWSPTRNKARNDEEELFRSQKHRPERQYETVAVGSIFTTQTEEETCGKGNDAQYGTDPDFQEIITSNNEGSETDAAKVMPQHVDIIMGVLNPETRGFSTESNAQRSLEEVALNMNHEEGDSEAINKKEAREPLLAKQEHVLDKSKPIGLANSKPK